MKRLEGIIVTIFAGIGAGAIASTVTIAAMGGMNDTIRQVLVWLAASALFTVISQIMCMDFGNLLVRTAIHFCLCFLLAVTVGSFLHYAADWLSCAKEMLPAFLIIYVVIYIGVFFMHLVETKELNRKLNA